MKLMEWVSKSLSFLYPFSYHGKKIQITIENRTQGCYYQAEKLKPGKFFILDAWREPLVKKISECGELELEHISIGLEDLAVLSRVETIIITIEFDGLILQTDLQSRSRNRHSNLNYLWIIKEMPGSRFSSRRAAIWNYCQPDLTAFCFYEKFDKQTLKLIYKYKLEIKNLYYWYNWNTRGYQAAKVGAYLMGLWFNLSKVDSKYSLIKDNTRYHDNFSYLMHLLYDSGFFLQKDMTKVKLRAIGRMFYLKKGIWGDKRKIWNMIFYSNLDLSIIREVKPIFKFFDKYQLIIRKIQRKYRQKQLIQLRKHNFFGFLVYYRIVNGFMKKLDQKLLRNVSDHCFNYLKCGHPIHKTTIKRNRKWIEIRKMLLQHHYNQQFDTQTPQIQFLCCQCHRVNMQKRRQRERTMKKLKQIFTNFHEVFTFVEKLEIEAVMS